MMTRTGAGVWQEQFSRVVTLWRRDPKGMSIDLLRVGMGLVWALNLIYILTPSNRYFSMFQSMASGYGSTTLGGPWFANWVAGSPAFFAWAIAILTAYLAVAFLAGITTRLACVAGGVASVAFLVTQFYATFALDGSGTDVGPHPLYLLIYLILFTAGAGQYFALDHWMWASGKARLPRLSRWVASPRDLPCNATCPSAEHYRAPAFATSTGSIGLGPTPADLSPHRTRSFRWGAITGVIALVALIVIGAALAMHQPSRSPPSATMVHIQDIQNRINYTGGASQGGFGPSMLDGCWDCASQVLPGSSVLELQMLSNNHSAASITVTSVSVAAPFSLIKGPVLPKTVPPGLMWMFDVTLGTPTVPGDYTVTITYTTE